MDKIGFTSRILKPHVENTKLADADRSAPTTGNVVLTTNKMIAEVHISYETLEDNIERGNLEQVIMQEMAKQVALDLEELVIQGDISVAGTDAYLGLQNGIIAQTSSHVIDATDLGPMSKDVLTPGIKAMPNKYLRNRAAFRWWMSPNNETDYRDSLTNRQTALGDSIIEGFRGVFHHGIPVMPAAMVPESNAILTRPDNVVWGVWRDIMVETDRDIRAQTFIIVLSLRAGMVLEEEDAVVVLEKIGAVTPPSS